MYIYIYICICIYIYIYKYIYLCIFTGAVSQYEVQAVEITAVPNQVEIQRIITSSSGILNEKWELKAAANIIQANRAVYQLASKFDDRSEVQLVRIRSSAYVLEVQTIGIDATVYNIDEVYRLDEDLGTMICTIGLFKSEPIPWNSTAIQV
jgi:hypothetical protein